MSLYSLKHQNPLKMTSPQLVWQSAKVPRMFKTKDNQLIPMSLMVYTQPSIECIARVVCRREIEEAKKRVIIERGKYFFQPSASYIRARLGFRPRTSKNFDDYIKNSYL